MQIDHDAHGHPRAILTIAAPFPTPANEKHFVAFIPVGEVLKLRHSSQILHGSPWLDVPTEEIIGLTVSGAESRKIQRWVERNLFVAIREVSDGRFDDNGQPVIKYRFSWRKLENYVTDPIDIAWLEQVGDENIRIIAIVELIEAIAKYFQRFRVLVEAKPKPKKKIKKKIKKKRIKVKERRRLERIR